MVADFELFAAHGKDRTQANRSEHFGLTPTLSPPMHSTPISSI